MYCQKCGTQNPEGANNCQNCGAPLNMPPAKKKKKKALVIILAVVAVLFIAIIVPSPDDSQQTTSQASTTQGAEQFIEKVKEKADGAIGKENETITDIKLNNKNLTVYVDISKADPSPLTYEQLAESRTSSITDAILELEEYYDLWESITIDFGKIGKSKNNKSDIEKNEYGSAYFPLEDFSLVGSSNEPKATEKSTSAVSAGSSTEPKTTEKSTTAVSLENRNALAAALNYLDYTAFSAKGLKEQLEYEGYSEKACDYAVKNCGANWNEQAAKCAKSYLDYSSFSRSGLIEQLEYEGFTAKQAEYGAKAVGY